MACRRHRTQLGRKKKPKAFGNVEEKQGDGSGKTSSSTTYTRQSRRWRLFWVTGMNEERWSNSSQFSTLLLFCLINMDERWSKSVGIDSTSTKHCPMICLVLRWRVRPVTYDFLCISRVFITTLYYHSHIGPSRRHAGHSGPNMGYYHSLHQSLLECLLINCHCFTPEQNTLHRLCFTPERASFRRLA